MRFFQLITILLWMGISYSDGLSQDLEDTHVYRVLIERQGQSLVQTGFRLESITGIVTALHGVVLARTKTSIRATNGLTVFRGLQISMVDVKRDLALLRSGELEQLPAQGLKTRAWCQDNPSPLTDLKVWGYPGDRPLTPVEVRAVDCRLFSKALPGNEAEVRDAFRVRGSPDLGVNVIFLQDQMSGGQSGAPLVTRTGEVVGVVSGGSRIDELNWAVPILEAEWEEAVYVEDTLDKLKKLSSSFLFDVQTTRDSGVRTFALEHYAFPGLFHIQEKRIGGWLLAGGTVLSLIGFAVSTPAYYDALSHRQVGGLPQTEIDHYTELMRTWRIRSLVSGASFLTSYLFNALVLKPR